MQLREVNQYGGRRIGTPARCLVQAEHLKAAGDREEQDRRCEEYADIVVREAYSFESACGRHFGDRLQSLGEDVVLDPTLAL
jgi:hypothetical protein